MNHQKIYNEIIERAKAENRKRLKKTNLNYIYYENHHIIPKCVGGSNDKDNLVLLTPREHYICHKLLIYIYRGNYKIYRAFHRMSCSKKINYKISSRDYAYAIELVKMAPISEETRKKMSESQTNAAIKYKNGSLNPTKRSSVKESISLKLKGKFKGDANPMANSSRKRENLKLLEEHGIKLKGDTHEYLRKKIKVTNLETNEIFVSDGVYNLIENLKINKRKYYAHLKDGKPILDKYVCEILH